MINDRCAHKPILIADADAIYNVATLGLAKDFDLFTPDPREMTFLADLEAEHPMYVTNPLFEIDTADVPKLIERAYEYGKAPKVLLVKGQTDYIIKNKKIVATIREPNIPALEPIGGTGDTITGIISALIYGGYDLAKAAIYAAKANRLAGLLAKPNPATQISEIIPHIPDALRRVMAK